MQDVVARVPRCRSSTCLTCWCSQGQAVPSAEGAFATCHCLKPAGQRTGILLLARSRLGPRHAPVGMVRDEVASRDGRGATHQSPHFVRVAAFPRSVAGPVTQGASLSGRRAVAGEARHGCSRRLYHIDPRGRAFARSSVGTAPAPPHCHGRRSSKLSPRWSSRISPADRTRPCTIFLRDDFDTLERRCGGVVGTTFRGFPSFPQRYIERLNGSRRQTATRRPRVPSRCGRVSSRRVHGRRLVRPAGSGRTRRGGRCGRDVPGPHSEGPGLTTRRAATNR